MHRLASIALLMLACSTPSICPTGLEPVGGACVTPDTGGRDVGVGDGGDGGMRDVGVDASVPPDAFMYPCGHACTVPTAVCDMSSHACVACLHDTDCSASTSHCEPIGHTCVQCLAPSDCAMTSASRCNTGTHACEACTGDGDCAHLAGTTACNAGTCVACTPTNETACGANSCNPQTHACTTTPRMSVATCHPCVADSECMSATQRCVPMQFMGAAHGSYCLPLPAPGCTRPYSVPTPPRASTSGAVATAYCGLDETATTCEAVLALIASRTCVTPSDCNAMGSQCQTVSLNPGRCTYACGALDQCPSGVACGAAMYCGSP